LLAHGVFGFEYLSFKNLTHIPLSGKLGSCALMKISTKFLSNLQYLTKVDLSLCQISVIEAGPFSNLSKLADLDLSLNHYLELSGVQNATIGMSRTNITTLNLEYIHARNPITIRRYTLSELNNTSLEILILKNNFIVKIDIKT
jgi:Leucine-rich repeat (LRR) protein